MQRAFIAVLIIVAVLAGAPYAALLINRIIGTNTVVFTEADGSRRTLIIGPDAAQPDWLPMMPGSRLVNAHRWLPNTLAVDSGGVELATQADVAAVKAFYTEALGKIGFAVEDDGLGPLNAATAAYLGMAGTLLAERRSTGHELTLQIRTPDGLIVASRLLQIEWRQLGPGQRSALAAYRAMRPEAK
jgi:hypothetical protein